MEYSAGIIPYRKDSKGNYEFLLAHPTGSGDYWAYMKGRIEEDETVIEAAIREFREESGLPDSFELSENTLTYLGKVRQRTNKTVYAYSLDYGDIDPSKCKSNLIDGTDKPENDMFRWMSYDDVVRLTHKKHIPFYDQIKNPD